MRRLFADVVLLVVTMALVMTRGTPGVLPGLWFSSGTGVMVLLSDFVIGFSHHVPEET